MTGETRADLFAGAARDWQTRQTSSEGLGRKVTDNESSFSLGHHSSELGQLFARFLIERCA